MNTTERQEARAEISSLKARYCRFIATKQWEALYDCFAPDASFDTKGSSMPSVKGRDGSLEIIRNGLNESESVHRCHAAEIEFSSDTSASAIWLMEDFISWPNRTSDSPRSLLGYGYYRKT